MRPKVFITRAIPENGIEMLKEHFEVEVWPEEREIPRRFYSRRSGTSML